MYHSFVLIRDRWYITLPVSGVKWPSMGACLFLLFVLHLQKALLKFTVKMGNIVKEVQLRQTMVQSINNSLLCCACREQRCYFRVWTGSRSHDNRWPVCNCPDLFTAGVDEMNCGVQAFSAALPPMAKLMRPVPPRCNHPKSGLFGTELRTVRFEYVGIILLYAQ